VNSIASALALLLPLVLVGFWLWMFMNLADTADVRPCFLSFTRNSNPKLDWAIMFVFLSLITAGIYFFTVYRNKT
jgi:hypothetical protein